MKAFEKSEPSNVSSVKVYLTELRKFEKRGCDLWVLRPRILVCKHSPDHEFTSLCEWLQRKNKSIGAPSSLPLPLTSPTVLPNHNLHTLFLHTIPICTTPIQILKSHNKNRNVYTHSASKLPITFISVSMSQIVGFFWKKKKSGSRINSANFHWCNFGHATLRMRRWLKIFIILETLDMIFDSSLYGSPKFIFIFFLSTYNSITTDWILCVRRVSYSSWI